MTTSLATNPLVARTVTYYELKRLDLDSENPRFGDTAGGRDQAAIVEYIVTQFGVDDVLASLATNGYFESEPLIVRDDGHGQAIVVEGNRRLAACLILANDPRARHVSNRRPKHMSHTWTPDTKVPAIVFKKDEQASLLPYLGVRHIVGSQQWDSYAKARWVDQVVSSGAMTLDQIERAIGDTHSTITRMLEGYRFIRQLIAEDYFNPQDSKRRGRGSNPHFPFSWVYTLLGFSPVREYLQLRPRDEVALLPLEKTQLRPAAEMVSYMFGNATRDPAISDSRSLRDLADAVVDPNKRQMLEKRKTIEEIVLLSRPTTDRMASLLRDGVQTLASANSIIAERSLSQSDAKQFVEPANKLRNLASSLFKALQATAYPGADDE